MKRIMIMKLLLLVLLMLFLASALANAQSTPDCGQFTYSSFYNPPGCIAVYEFPWVPISHGDGFSAYFEFPNNTSGNIRVAEVHYRNTARDGKVQFGSVVELVGGSLRVVEGVASYGILYPGGVNTLDIVDTNCDLSSNLCATQPPEMDLSVMVTYIVDLSNPQLLANLAPPTVNIKDTFGGKLIWQYKYQATRVDLAPTAMSANIYVGGGTSCSIAAMNVDLGSHETALISAFLLDPQTGETFDQGDIGVLVADQNAAISCSALFPNISKLTAPANFDLLVVTTALTSSKLAIIVPQIGNGGGMNGFVTSQAVFLNLKGLKGLK